MKTLLLIILSVVFISCGKPSSGGGSSNEVTCHNDVNQFKTAWRDTLNNDIFDVSTCGVDTPCNFCNLNDCNGFDDFELTYNTDYIRIEYFVQGTIFTGTWQICGDELELNFSDGSGSNYKKVGE